MTNRILGLVFGLFLIFSGVKAEAGFYYWNPYHGSVIVNGSWLGWGLFGNVWPATYYYPTFPVYGYSYWSYYNYQPYYASYGAIAYSESTGEVGVSWNASTRQAAQEDAIAYCGEEDCKPAVWVQGGCGALSKSATTGALGYAYYSTRYQAQNYANRGCRRSGSKDCKPLAWVCSW